MPRKKPPSSGAPPLRLITDDNKKKKRSHNKKPKLEITARPDESAIEVVLSSLLAAPVKPRSLASGAYQKKLLAAVAPRLIMKMLKAVDFSLNFGDLKAVDQTGAMYNIPTTNKAGGGVSVFVNQSNSNDNRSVTTEKSNLSGFESMVRLAHEEREKRLALPAASVQEFDPTPEE